MKWAALIEVVYLYLLHSGLAGTLMTWLCCRELTFKKGDAVNIIRQIDNNWYEGEHRGRIGIFPMSYVEVSAKLLSCTRDVHLILLFMQFFYFFSSFFSNAHSSLMFTHKQKMPSSEKQQPIRPPPPAHIREIGEAIARYNFNADTNVELSLRKVSLTQKEFNWEAATVYH